LAVDAVRPDTEGYPVKVRTTGGETVTQQSDATRYSEWSVADLPTYRSGTIVTHQGRKYRVKPWPADGWARQSDFEPGLGPWRYAWDEL
jgi:hypothetical protein